ncbi:M12 family metallopeptidase [Corallococcus exercitus]|uniref:M12 family metallopeptidase n=1 Tax=Corallococcus exercitus TaxID=2316736 RepID=UPI0035D4405A
MSSTAEDVKPWPARKVPFIFVPEDHPYKGDILSAMEKIEANTRIWFCQRGNEEHYVRIIYKAEEGNWSESTGVKQPQSGAPIEQEMNITAGHLALHELGHVLGLIHEQSRSDRDMFIEVQWADIPGSENHKFGVNKNTKPLTEYDHLSVMHYPAPATGWGGPPDREVWTMRLKTDRTKPLGGGVRGWGNWTQSDIDGVNKLYENFSGWSDQRQVPGVGTTSSPALAVFQSRLYLAWKGSGDQHIWWSSFDGANWSGQQQVPGVGTTDGPALAVFQNRLYMAWKGSGDQHIWWSSFDGANWSGQQQVPGVGTMDSPALAVFQNRLYMAWKGNGDQYIWWSSFDGANWSGQQQVPGVGTTDSPALAVFQNRLYMAWKGNGDQGLWWSSFDGASWSGQQRYQFAGTRHRPAIAALGSRLYVTWRGSGDQHIWYADFNGGADPWSGQARVGWIGTTVGPTLAEYAGRLYMSWMGSGDQHLWYADFTRG